MKRRNFLRAAGVTGVATTGVIGASVMSGSAEATTNTESEASAVLQGSSDSGIVNAIDVWASGSVEWSGLDAKAQYVDIMLEAKDRDDDYHEVATTRFNDIPAESSSSEPLEFAKVGGDLLENTAWEASDFSAAEDGETRKTHVELRVTAVVCATDDDRISDSNDHRVKVKITNEERGGGLNSTVGGNVSMAESPNGSCGEDC